MKLLRVHIKKEDELKKDLDRVLIILMDYSNMKSYGIFWPKFYRVYKELQYKTYVKVAFISKLSILHLLIF